MSFLLLLYALMNWRMAKHKTIATTRLFPVQVLALKNGWPAVDAQRKNFHF